MPRPPPGICTSSSAHRRFQEWTQAGVFEAFWREDLLAYDDLIGIDWTWLSLDGAMGTAPLGGRGKTGPNPIDRSKRGVERSALIDGRSVPIGFVIAGANVNDHLPMREILDAIPVAQPRPTKRAPQHLCLDEGYEYAAPRAPAEERGFTLQLRRRGEEIQAKRHRAAKARRWVVAPAHAWLNLFRGILVLKPKKPQNYRALPPPRRCHHRRSTNPSA